MAVIVIKMKSKINNCWSPYQYTDQCHTCEKVLTCKIKSNYHAKGIKKRKQIELRSKKRAFKHSLLTIYRETRKSLKQIT